MSLEETSGEVASPSTVCGHSHGGREDGAWVLFLFPVAQWLCLGEEEAAREAEGVEGKLDCCRAGARPVGGLLVAR